MTPQTVARQAPLSMGFSRQEYWSGLPLSTLGDLPDPGIKPESPASPASQVDSSPLSHWERQPHLPGGSNADYGPASTAGYGVADSLLWAKDVLELARTS